MSQYESFKEKILKKTGINLSLYKEKQMKRRIESLASRNGYSDLNLYFNAIDKDIELFKEFINYMTINVSEFYRNPEQWKIVESEIFPALIKKKGNIKIWSAACSTGEEPYTITMILSQHLPLSKISIVATDIDKEAMAKAQTGIYSENSLKNVPSAIVSKYFSKVTDKTYSISDEIKKCVSFKQHNLLKDKFVEGCDLIVCRNVLIYFTEEAKAEIYSNFSKSLNTEGILFVGSTEQIISPQKYNLKPIKTFFYTKSI
ncbi:CheR [Acetoanaerobium sticklandii]|uniref:protein-glutamate O-methyltransferase n=1 Tax=Acetoanaerobium sticklandii (strain ATCC 12662 / DSM 519 / JCM 1433 / CCUG 9281 / NCIMB 10654 / HF) TaxID=499177 RepID=E3PRT0_ACESD|nr:protein-glutamate O-methyltransferase CheR [Acetoanaerobium sticklandii]CBH21584.1 CheR [Acetoanaerobium sticklandii]